MVSETRIVHLGQAAFVLSPDGEVVRTMVGELDEKGYRLLNGYNERSPHWFSFQDAVAAANNRISVRQTALRKELRVLARKCRELETQNYRDCVMNASSYRVVDLRDETTILHGRRSRPRELKTVLVPDEYQIPGSMVYTIITPRTHSKFDAAVYRPYKHFILETKVTSVCFSPDGKAHHTFSTPFVVEEFFLYRKDAIAKLESFSEPGTRESAPFVSHKQEKAELKLLELDDDIPF